MGPDEVRENDHVFLTQDASKDAGEVATLMSIGGVIKKVDEKGIAEVVVTRVLSIHVSRLTTNDLIP